jgi:transcriptional regulator with XRE-family HTH domain
MATSEIEQWWIDKFQENLGPIRKVAGWTTQQLADELGVARQTVSNLETGKSPMTKLQYLALRTVFSAEIARREDRDLARIIKTLVDDPIEQRIRERRAQEQDGEAVADNAPVNTGCGNAADNAATEQVFGHLKDEFHTGRRFASYEEFKNELDAYIIHWNTRRRQIRLEGHTPEEFRNMSLTA